MTQVQTAHEDDGADGGNDAASIIPENRSCPANALL
jgi:hypothetical protein